MMRASLLCVLLLAGCSTPATEEAILPTPNVTTPAEGPPDAVASEPTPSASNESAANESASSKGETTPTASEPAPDAGEGSDGEEGEAGEEGPDCASDSTVVDPLGGACD